VADRAAGEVLARTTTGEDGRFLLEVPGSSFEVVAVPPGHERLEAKVEARPGEEREETFFLESSATGFEVVVRGERVRREVTRQVLPAEEVAKAAGSQGDTLKAVLNLPGVARPQFGAGTLVLRGASPGDSRVFLEGQELPILYHFGGLRSTVNPRFLDAVEFLPGNFSADYGRAMGGVVEVRLRDPARDAFRGQVSASLYDAGFALEGPVGEWAVGGAFHRSWIDTILSAVLPDDAGFSFDVAPRYYDYQLVAVRPLWDGKLRLTWYGSMDRFSLLFDDPQEDPKISGTLRGGIFFHGLQARHEGKVTALLRHDTSLQLSLQRFDTQFGPEFFFDLDVWQGSLRSAWTLALAERLEARAGLDVVLAPVTIRANVPRPPQEGEPDTPVSTRPTQGVRQTLTNYEPAAFAELRWRPVPSLTVTPAVRVDWFRSIESWAVDPRLSARLELGADTAVKAGIGSYQQAPEPPESARDIGNPDLGPERSVHVSAGVERRLPWANATVEATGFWKRLDRLVVLNPATEFDPAAPVYLNEGTGRIHGAELLLRARGERWFGWLAYTFQRSLREDGFGRAERPFDFDQPHILTALASWAFRPGWTAGARFRLVSGNPDTPVTGSVLDAQTGVFVPVYGRVNSERLPAFHQLDLRIDRTWTYDTWKLTAWLDVQNAYNRGNPEGWTYRYDYRERTPLTGLPILPIVGVQGEW
jgi:outer membrane receptor protein involved in Fe transport